MNVKVNITTDSGSDVDQVSRAVATRLKAYRKEKKMSLDELSRRASISKGMLVEMEKEAANPSIAILCKLAAALGVSVADSGKRTRVAYYSRRADPHPLARPAGGQRQAPRRHRRAEYD